MSSSLSQRDQAFIWHPYTQHKNNLPPIPIVKGNGVLLEDANGLNYIDAISSWWVNLHGHSNPYIARKIYEQALLLEQVIFAGFTHQPAVDLAERLLRILPGNLSKIFYSDNGSTAVEVALKMAIQFWWNQGHPHRKKILALTNAYHGDTFGAMSVSERGIFTLAFHDHLFDVIYIDPPDEGNADAHRQLLDEFGNEIAAFIYEPILQGAGGMKTYAATALDRLLAMVKERNIVCIADEVMTGFGRIGPYFASSLMKLNPDIICLSKGLTGGTMALGVTACTEAIYNAFLSEDKMKTFFHGHSFTANPLACAAGLASLDLLMQPECEEKRNWIIARNLDFLEELNPGQPSKPVRNPRMQGTVLAFELDSGKNEYLNSISAIVSQKSISKGVFLRPLGNTLYIMPPYCITEEQLDKVYTTIREILLEI